MSHTEVATAWVTAAEIARMLGSHHRVVRRLAAEGRIRSRVIIGASKPRYAASDVAGLLKYEGGSLRANPA